MLRTFEGGVHDARRRILHALHMHGDAPEVCVAAMADILGAVAADLTVQGLDGTITLDQRLDLFIERARQAYRRRLTTRTVAPQVTVCR